MNINPSLNRLSSTWGQSQTAGAQSQRYSSLQSAGYGSDAAGGMRGPQGGPPPGPPPDFAVQRSTTQFAGSRSDATQDLISALDADGDGSISGSEFGLDTASSDVQAFFTATDTDQDGTLSAAEIESMRSQLQDAMQALAASQMQAGMGRSMGPPPPPSVTELDQDQDGTVSASEFGLDGASEDVQALFDQIDTDQDGTLSAEEMASFDSEMQSFAQALRAAGGEGPPDRMGPPPELLDAGSGTQQGSSSRSELSQAQQTARDVSAMLERIAQDYLSLTGSDQASVSLTTVSVSA